MRRMTPYEIEWYEENKNKPNHPAAFITPGYASKHICLARAPLLSFLSVESEPRSIYSPFVSPLLGYIPGVSEESRKKTLGSKIPRSDYKALIDLQESGVSEACAIEDGNLPPDNPLVLYRSAEGVEPRVEIRVDSMLSRYLREHQRQGVQFVFNCLMGLKDFNGNGCILADDMGLGKTLQSITVMWTLLKQGLGNVPAARKCAIICPASLVNNWESEINKWLKGRCFCTTIAENSREKVISKFEGFRVDFSSRVLIASYEAFRMHASRISDVQIDLLICDEAHRLKNDKSQTAICIANSSAKMRLMLSGTPIQNDLNEFYSLVSLCNPDVLGDIHSFRRNFANVILIGREPDATPEQQKKAAEKVAELSHITNQFVLRRTNVLLAKVLPPKVVMNVFCNLTPIQREIYVAITHSKSWKKIVTSTGVTSKSLGAIQTLMKLCNHPSLVKKEGGLITAKVGALLSSIESSGNGFARSRNCRSSLSGKVLVLYRLLYQIRRENDKVVIISNYTQTLDVFERLCRECCYPFVRLDGTTSIKKRHGLVTKFNNPEDESFVFLLSSKAGGCGINLIGANRLILFDPDWNPANDKQALARVWRDGQKKLCYIYRLFSTGTIEEKIYQRQISKDGLSSMLVTEGENELKDSLSSDFLKNLFEYKGDTLSDTHDSLECSRCKDAKFVPQMTQFVEDDLITWAHHADLNSLPDPCLIKAATVNEPIPANQTDVAPADYNPISFVMTCRVEWKPEDANAEQSEPHAEAPKGEQEEREDLEVDVALDNVDEPVEVEEPPKPHKRLKKMESISTKVDSDDELLFNILPDLQ